MCFYKGRRGHTVRFESVRRKRDFTESEKCKMLLQVFCLEGNHWSVFSLAAGLGHSGEPQWTACIRDLRRGEKSR